MSWDDIPFWTGIGAGSQSWLFSPSVNCVSRRISRISRYICRDISLNSRTYVLKIISRFPPLFPWTLSSNEIRLKQVTLMGISVPFSLSFLWRKEEEMIGTPFPFPWASQSQSLPGSGSVCTGFIRISRFDHLFAAKTFQSDPIQDPAWIIDNSIEESEIGRTRRRGEGGRWSKAYRTPDVKLWFIFILNGAIKCASRRLSQIFQLNSMQTPLANYIWYWKHFIYWL